MTAPTSNDSLKLELHSIDGVVWTDDNGRKYRRTVRDGEIVDTVILL